MQLKNLHINGFKSFSKKGDIEFSTPITAIVGPNGSGKSNIAEAFRFVLGEQSLKSMRGKKGEDLIFNGSDSASRANRAAVSVTLNNKEENGTRAFPLDFDEIVIERVVHRDGMNEYSINGSKSRLKDVQELLASANIGASGHHIISQGEADHILTANPKERREMVEDALGLKVYQYKKVESEKKLKKTEENVAQVESLRKEVLPHLKFLERQVKKAEKSLELQEKLKVFYASYLRREDSYIAYHHDRLKNEKQAPEARLRELAHELEAAKQKMETGEKDEKRDQLVALEKSISQTRSSRQEIVRQTGQIEGQITFLERRIEDLKKKEGKQEAHAIEFSKVKALAETAEQDAQQAAESEDVSLLKRTLTGIVDSLQALLHESEKVDDAPSYEEEEKELKQLIQEKEEVDATLQDVSQKEQALNAQYNELKASIEAESSESREAEREIFKIMNEQREVEQKISNIERELSMLERDRTEFKRELQEAVSLLGRDASLYYQHVVRDEDGNEVPRQAILEEQREKQHERRRELEKMKIRLEELGIGSNEELMKEYKDVKERDAFLQHEIQDLEESVQKLEKLIAELTEQLNQEFIAGLEKIGKEFSRFFELMFGGGVAELKRVKPKVRKKKEDDMSGVADEVPDEPEEDEEAEEGIEIDVKLPNKRVRGLDMLSGGERALTSIALIFAMSQVNPPPFIILDETDAALDEANSKRYGDMIESLAKKSQLILITHNRETMSRAGVLYGITMGGDGVSKLLSVKFDEAIAVAK